MIITIDGPAGAGKSTVARALAKRLGTEYLDTGAMYRAVAVAALQHGLDWKKPDDLADLARKIDITMLGDRVLLDGNDVSEAIRTPEVTAVTHYVADNRQVRERLVDLQRKIAQTTDFVTEGRDQSTLVFPQAECKIFLTASPEERARRRLGDLKARGMQASFEEILASQQNRDAEDSMRPFGALIQAEDAMEICTDGMTVEEIVDQLVILVRRAVPVSRKNKP